jgi:hypothetical protein
LAFSSTGFAAKAPVLMAMSAPRRRADLKLMAWVTRNGNGRFL